jgi:hypothetical protein
MNDKPDFDRLLKVLWMEGEPDRVPFYELFVDREVIEAITGEPMPRVGIGGAALVSGGSEEEKARRDLTARKLANVRKHYVKAIIKFYRGLGYDYLSSGICTLEMPKFYEKRWDWMEDTAEKPHDQRT